MARLSAFAEDRVAILRADEIAAIDAGFEGEPIDLVTVAPVGHDHEFPIVMRVEAGVVVINLVRGQGARWVVRVQLEMIHDFIIAKGP